MHESPVQLRAVQQYGYSAFVTYSMRASPLARWRFALPEDWIFGARGAIFARLLESKLSDLLRLIISLTVSVPLRETDCEFAAREEDCK